ncbi:type I-D CRISPR-associated protein Cas5/Csc1 [Ktedonosporobacter rubrisoli]|nr:type I-D CRISPR-associated protein Cas5/Csc1 [Ktedonosporobacter rubrisoli]
MFAYIARCHITLHDNLYYASHEFGRFYETEKYLHNYGLTYALGLVRPAPPFFTASQEPRYREDLYATEVAYDYYVTPARPLHVDFALNTFKLIDAHYYNVPVKESRNRVVFGRAKEITPGSTFEYFVYSQIPRTLPHWIRLGKWLAKAEMSYKWYSVGTGEAPIVSPPEAQRIACPLNPLDIADQQLATFDVVMMPPSSLLVNVSIVGPCCCLPAEPLFHDEPSKDIHVPIGMRYFEGVVKT